MGDPLRQVEGVSNPLGSYGAPVAALLAVLIVLAALASHIVPGLVPDTFLDNLALITTGVVFGTQVVQNGTQSKATDAFKAAVAANQRLDAINAPSAPTVNRS